MDTDIAYLRLLRDDLRAAAARPPLAMAPLGAERADDGGAETRTRSRGRRTPVLLRLSAAAAVIALAGLIGAIATEGGGLAGFATGGGAASRAIGSPASGGVAGPADAGRAGVAIPEPTTLPGAVGKGALHQERAADQLTGTGSASSTAGAAPGSESSGGSGIPEVSKVIKTADLSIVVAPASFGAKFQAATEIAERLGGFVESSSEQARSGHLVMRVPARDFDEARRQLKALGISVVRETIDGQDVTSQFVDLKARLEILQARKDALVKLLHEASSLETILRLQNVVDDVLTRIEELKGEIHLINDRTSNATISLAMREKGVQVAPVVDKPSLGGALARGVAGFLSVLYAIVVGLGYLVPIAAIALLAWMGVRVARRRTERATSAADA
jgi:hypothetical protein